MKFLPFLLLVVLITGCTYTLREDTLERIHLCEAAGMKTDLFVHGKRQVVSCLPNQ